MLKNIFFTLLTFFLIPLVGIAQNGEISSTEAQRLQQETEELAAQIRNMPNVEVGKGVTFIPKDSLYKMTMRFRMQNMVAINLNEDFETNSVDAMVKRLRLRFDGYILSPKLTYSIQLGFTPYDAEIVPNGNMNIVRDAMVYYLPNNHWNIGFGQTKIKANRARINSSSALQFVDRSIVNSQFNPDRDFGFFGEYNGKLINNFNVVAKGSITTGDGRNWGNSKNSGLAYTGRLELFPLGRFKAYGDVFEGDFERENTPKFMIAGAYSYNDRAIRTQGERGVQLIDNERRSIGSYFFDFIFKYSGFAFYIDYMGRTTQGSPIIAGNTATSQYIYTGNGLNLQASYLFANNWEVALRNSTINPASEVESLVGYTRWNQSTVGVTKYLIGHSLKIQADASYNNRKMQIYNGYNKWEFRLQIELGL